MKGLQNENASFIVVVVVGLVVVVVVMVVYQLSTKAATYICLSDGSTSKHVGYL